MYSRTTPLLCRIKERQILSGPHSTKQTYHIVLDTMEAHFPFKPGDSIAVFPTNSPEEVDTILEILRANPEEPVIDSRTHELLPLRTFLLNRANLSRANSALLKLLVEKGAPLGHLLAGDQKGALNEFLHQQSLADLLCHAPITPFELAKTAMPLLPRFYSIANSLKVFPGEIHLLVSYVQYSVNGKTRRGIGSHFLCDLASLNCTPIPIYLQPSAHFTLPQDPTASIILIGPGTGIAPFRAFIQERLALQAPGCNWIFFGERNRTADFYYADFWLELEKQGRIRLDLAFSRDGEEKEYVQHKMYEQRKSLWHWIEEGAYFYVCGDAEKMAKDVDATLHRIVKEEGGLSEEETRLYIKKMRQEKRYLTDVY